MYWKDFFDLIFDLCPGQYGIFAYEYRNPVTLKQGCKTADILACAVDESEKIINTFIFDVKSNISAFSDNLLRDNALLTVVKEMRDFVEQIHAEMLHKDSFILYYIIRMMDLLNMRISGLLLKALKKKNLLLRLIC